MNIATATRLDSRAGHAALSHPEAEERSGASRLVSTTDLRARLSSIRSEFSTSQIGRALGYSDGTQVIKYLNDKVDFDLPKFEDRLSAWLRTLDRRRLAVPTAILNTSVVRQLAAWLSDLAPTRLVGVATGSSGIGLTVAALEFSRQHAPALCLAATASHRDATGIRGLIFNELRTRGYDGHTSRWDYIVEQLAGSGRLLIIDNAHRLNGDGLDWIYDLHDATGCPVALVGNSPVLARVRAASDRLSRTWPAIEVSLDQPKQVAAGLVDQVLPEHASALVPLAATHIAQKSGGHLRGVLSLLHLARKYLSLPKCDGNPVRAWNTALAASIHS